MDAPVLVGRDEELALLDEAAARGAGLVVSGGPGVGKTALVRAFLGRAEARGEAVVRAVATRSAGSIPLGALAPLLPPLVPGAAGMLDLLQGAARALVAAAGGRRLVVTIDDAHLLDDVSASLVHQLAATEQAVAVVTLRTGEPAPDAIVALWKDGLAERVELQPLSIDEAKSVVGQLLDGQVDAATSHRLAVASQGNVLLLREVVLSGRHDGALQQRDGVWMDVAPIATSPRLRELIAERLAGLEHAATTALAAVALADRAGPAILGASAPRAALDDLEERGLVVTEADGRRLVVRVVHPLHAEVVRADLPEARARGLFGVLAEALAATGARRRTDPLDLGAWRLSAGTPGNAALLEVAATQARARLDHHLAVRLLDAAVLAGAGSGARLRLASARWEVGDADGAERDVAVLLADDVDDVRVEATVFLAQLRFYAHGDVDGAEAALALAGPDPHAVACRATLQSERGLPTDALATVAALLDDPPADLSARVRVRHAVVWVLPFCGAADRAEALVAEGMQDAVAVSGPLRFPTAALLLAQSRAHLVRGELDAAAALADAQYADAVAHGAEEVRGHWAIQRARVALCRGDLESARRALREAVARLGGEDLRRLTPSALGLLAVALAHTGDSDGAARAAAAARSALDAATGLWATDVALGSAWASAATGEATRARQEAVAAAEEAAARGLHAFAALAAWDAARLGAGRPARAALIRAADHVDGPLGRALAAASAALCEGDAPALEHAGEKLSLLGARLWAAECIAAAATAHQREGRTGSGLAAAARARALIDAVTARTPLLASLDGPDALARLTEREREVALLAAQGLTKREIAERLVLSVRTVGNHLYNVYAKLGISSREELGDVLGSG